MKKVSATICTVFLLLVANLASAVKGLSIASVGVALHFL